MALTQEEVQQFSEEKLRADYLNTQRIVVHIWTSGFNVERQGKNIGHVSITSPGNFYLSLWPTSAGKTRGTGIIDPIDHEFKPNFDADVAAEEGRRPELTLSFYTLNSYEIKKRYDDIRMTTTGWSATGSALCGNIDSCVSSVWKLLLAGNIRNLLPELEQFFASAAGSSYGASLSSAAPIVGAERSVHGSSYSSEIAISPIIKSPDAVFKYLTQAKKKELEMEPITKRLHFLGETPIQDLPQNKCLDKTLYCLNYLKAHPEATILGVSVGVAGLAWASGYTEEMPEFILNAPPCNLL